MTERKSLSSWVLLLLILISLVAYLAYRNGQSGEPADPIELKTPNSPAATKNDPYYGVSGEE